MKSWLVIADLAAAVFLVIMLHTTYLEIDNYKSQYNEQRLMRSSEYACECAFYYASGASDNNVLYISPADRIMTPQKVLNNFDDIMALCYGMSIGDHSRIIIEDSIGTACLVSGDGFYVTDLAETDENEYNLVWSPKIPYTADANEIDNDPTNDNVISGTTYGVTLTSEDWRRVHVTGSGPTAAYTYEHKEAYNLDLTGTMNREVANRIVATKLTNAIAYSVDRNSRIRNSSDYSIFIPTSKTQGGINSMKNPTLLVVLKNAEYAKWDGIGATLAGFQIVTGTKAISYMKNGRKMYSYEGQGAMDDGFTVIKIYDTAEQAAEAGCYPDTDYLFKPIVGATAD